MAKNFFSPVNTIFKNIWKGMTGSSRTSALIGSAMELNKNIQPYILRPHGKTHLKCIFIEFHKKMTADQIRKWISEQAKFFRDPPAQMPFHFVFSAAAAQQSETENNTDDIIASILLSGRVYQKMGVQSFPNEAAFRRGMLNTETREILSDPKPQYSWDDGYRSGYSDVMIMLAANESEPLDALETIIAKTLIGGKTGRIMVSQAGRTLTRPDRPGWQFEHFGFRDSVTKDPDHLTHALVKEPGSKDRWGSYLVFRKLEQNVKEFNEFIDGLAGATRLEREEAEARVMGRFRDGTPIIFNKDACSRTPEAEKAIDLFNQGISGFEELESTYGSCPVHAHIRKANPRTGSGGEVRIVRRSIPYDERTGADRLNPLPEHKVGLLFMCYQKSISKQFEHIHQSFCNNDHFPAGDTGPDPIVGNMWHKKKHVPQKWVGENGASIKHPFDQSVWIKGGEYFYAPSVPHLIEMNGS